MTKKLLTDIIPDNARNLFEATDVFSEIMKKGIELIYFDEFTINIR